MSRLGRGLEALISKSFTVKKIQEIQPSPSSSNTQNGVIEVELEKIKTNPYQPRKNFDQMKLEELAKSIRHHGILQPLLVSKKENGEYELLAGERRLLAAKMAGLKKVPVIVKDATAQQKIELALVENLQRHDLNPIEKAQAFKKLAEEFGLTQEEIAKKIGKSRSEVANIMRLLSLDPEIQRAIFEEKITFGHAKVILGIEDKAKQLEMLNQIIHRRFSVSKAESEARKIKVKAHLRSQRKTPEIQQLEDKLQEAFGTKVKIKTQRGRGQIIIEFYSQEELYNLASKIIGEEVGE